MSIKKVSALAGMVLASSLLMACGSGMLMVTPGPLKPAYAESVVSNMMTKSYGTAGEKSRTISGTVEELQARGGVLESLPGNHSDLIFVERKGSFSTPSSQKLPSSGAQSASEVYPYAAIVLDASTGQVVTTAAYAETYRPH